MTQKHNVSSKTSASIGESRCQTAAYIADLVSEMEQLARLENIGRLESLLRAARQEAAKFAAVE